MTGEFPAQRASNAENVSIGLRHHERVTESHHAEIDNCNGFMFDVYSLATALLMHTIVLHG